MDQCCVCGSAVDANNPPNQANYQGQNYNFCCDDCQEKFNQNPQLYANRQAA